MKTMRLFWTGAVGLFAMAGFGQTTATPTSTLTTGGLQSGTAGTGAYYGYQAGKVSTGTANAFYGNGSGAANTTGASNSCFGNAAGVGLTTGGSNTFVGSGTGNAGGVPTNVGSRNCYVGMTAGPYVNGSDNVCIGAGTMNYNTTAIAKTTAIGTNAGIYGYGSENIYIGYQAGAYKTGSNNVFIGNNVGESASNKLNIDNAANATPLIWGDFTTTSRQVKLNAKTGIGAVVTFPTASAYTNYRLFVTGGILADEVRVKLSASGTWADYVFNDDYKLLPLNEVEKHICEQGHLPNVPSAAEVMANGIELGEVSKMQQEKIEELTLYLIQQNKEIETLKAQMSLLLNKK